MENGDIKALLLLLHSESTCYKLDPNNHVSVLDFRLDVTTVDGKDDLLFVDSKATYRNNKLCFQLTKSIYGDGSVTQTSVFLYGMGHKAGLVVLQRHYNGTLPILTLIYYSLFTENSTIIKTPSMYNMSHY